MPATQETTPQEPSGGPIHRTPSRPGGAGVRGNSYANGFYGPPENVSRGLYGEARGQWEGVA